MPQREAKFAVNAQPADVWRFIRDFESLCTCIPGVERISLVDHRTVELTVKERIGVVPLILDLTALIDSEQPPHRLHATARAEHLTMEIDIELRPAGPGTELLGLIKVSGQGQLKPVVDRLFEKRADERAAQFAASLEQRFGAVAPAGLSQPCREGHHPAEASAGSTQRWLDRLWQRILRWFAPRER
jgi:carbon monoxide dehydrogenase subunit G